MTPARHTAAPVWMKTKWRLTSNPFPPSGIVRHGGKDPKENGLLYDERVNQEKFTEAIEKFVLGATFSGLRFGFLWSRGVGGSDMEARGFGKSALMQHLCGSLNQDFGRAAYLASGLDEEDANEAPICGLLASFDTTQIRSLAAAMFDAAEYAVRFRTSDNEPTLATRLRDRLVAIAGDDDPAILGRLVMDEYRGLRGRTLGPPDDRLIGALCDPDPRVAADYLGMVKPATRQRNGANYLATFLLFAASAGIERVLLCCDQLEDLASPRTAKAKRELETERFRDVVLETLPMADMLAVVVTMHPRAALAIAQAWQLADLPSFEISSANEHQVVTLEPLHHRSEVDRLLEAYLNAARKDGGRRDDLSPMTAEAVDALFHRSNGRPRDILRKAHAIFERAAADNLDSITPATVVAVLDALTLDDDDDIAEGVASPGHLDWEQA